MSFETDGFLSDEMIHRFSQMEALEVNHQFELRRRLNWKIGRLLALEDTVE